MRLGSTGALWTKLNELGARPGAINMGQGFPDYAMPEFVKDAAVAAIREDYNQYSRPAGHHRLVEKLAERYSPRLGPKFRMIQRMLSGDVAQWLALYPVVRRGKRPQRNGSYS